MEKILSDKSKFQEINKDPFKEINRLQNKMRRYLPDLLKENFLTQEKYDSIYPTGSQPAILYGSPKVHKPNLPLRPVMSSINTYNRKLSEFLIPFLTPITTNQYTVPSSFAFCTEITPMNCNTHCIMSSFDVESLFTTYLYMKL